MIFKCKMCGGSMDLADSPSVICCEYCGTKQTLPRLGTNKRANLYDRAGHFRRNNDFDKAMQIYEQILNDDPEDAESYWSLVLCKYGIEYVEDPTTQKRIPTVNRTQTTSVFADEDYKSAIKYADEEQKELYRQEAQAIDDIQKGILGDWKDSAHRLQEAKELKEELKRKKDREKIGNTLTVVVVVAVLIIIIVGILISNATHKAAQDKENAAHNKMWSNIIAMTAGDSHTVGLKKDGTCVAVGDNEHGQCDVSDWKDISAVSAGYWHTVGIKKDGTCVPVGRNEYGQCNVGQYGQ